MLSLARRPSDRLAWHTAAERPALWWTGIDERCLRLPGSQPGHRSPCHLPRCLGEPTQPLVVGLLLAWAWACLVLLPRFALLVVAGDLVAAALRGSLSPVSLTLRLMALLATGAALLLLAKGV